MVLDMEKEIEKRIDATAKPASASVSGHRLEA